MPALAPIVCHNGNVDNLQNTGTFHFGNQNRDERASDVIGDESAPACNIGLSSRCRITTSFRQTNWSNVRRILEEDQIDHWFKPTKLYILIGIWILFVSYYLNGSVKSKNGDIESISRRTELEVRVNDGPDHVVRLRRERLDVRVQLVLAQCHRNRVQEFVLEKTNKWIYCFWLIILFHNTVSRRKKCFSPENLPLTKLIKNNFGSFIFEMIVLSWR